MAIFMREMSTVPEVQAIVDLVNQNLEQHPDKLDNMAKSFGDAIRLASCLQVPDEMLEDVYQVAFDYYQKGQYRDALPLALHLTVYKPTDVRFMFMTGMIVQLLGDPLLAAAFYTCLLKLDSAFIPAVFRLGECLSDLSELPEARRMFEKTVELGRDDPEQHQLQSLALDKAKLLH